MNNKKILIVSEYFAPSDNSTSYYITKIAQKLSEDNSVKVICNTEIKEDFKTEDNNLNVFRIKETKLNKNNILTRSIKFLISSLKLIFYTNKSIEKDTYIFSVTNPAFIIVFLALLKKIRKFHCTLLVYDVFPENLFAANILKSKTSLIYKVVKSIFDWAYMQSDRLIVIGRDMEEVIKLKTNNNVPIILIENWCDYTKIIPSDKQDNELLKKLDIADKKIFLFAGNLGRVQGIENMLKASKLVKSKNFMLLFIGDGAMRKEIEMFIETNSLNNVMYGGSFPSSEQNLFLNACDVAIVSLASSMYGLGVPSKSYFNMASSKPLLYIGDEKSELGRVINEHQIGWIVENGNEVLLAEQFDKICTETYDFEGYGKKAREVVKNYYSENKILDKYKKLY